MQGEAQVGREGREVHNIGELRPMSIRVLLPVRMEDDDGIEVELQPAPRRGGGGGGGGAPASAFDAHAHHLLRLQPEDLLDVAEEGGRVEGVNGAAKGEGDGQLPREPFARGEAGWRWGRRRQLGRRR